MASNFNFFQSRTEPREDILDVFFNPLQKAFGEAERRDDKQRARDTIEKKKTDTEALIQKLEKSTTDQEKTAILARLAAVQSPQFAQVVERSIAGADLNELKKAQRKADQGFKIATGLLKMPHAQRDGVIRQLIAEKKARKEPTNRLEALIGKDKDEMETGLKVMEFTNEGIKALTDKEAALRDEVIKKREDFTIGKDQERRTAPVPATAGQPEIPSQLIAAGPTTAATSNIAKIKPEQYTPRSFQAFLDSGQKDFSLLEFKPTAPNATIMSALLPIILAGVDINDPQELAGGLATVALVGKALSGGTAKELAELQKLIPKKKAAPKNDKGKGLIEKGTDLLKQGGKIAQGIQSDVSNFLIEMSKKYLGEGTPEAKQVEDFIEKSRGFPEWTAERMAKTEPDARVDEDGFWYIPNPKFPNGKQFLRDAAKNQGGRKIRSKN